MQSGYMDKSGVPEPGWSDRVDNPEILAGVAKKRRAAQVRRAVLFVVALTLLPTVSHFTGDPPMREAVAVGCVFAGFVFLISWMSKHRGRSYEAVVTYKKETSNSSRSHEYETRIELSDGGRDTIRERGWYGGASAWSYLRVGDRFRYHPQFEFRYELYDKAKADHLFCAVCCTKNPVEADRCQKCHAPLLK
jgi:ribosomal protein L40E